MAAVLDPRPEVSSAGTPAHYLRCRACGARQPLAPENACAECFGPLEVGYAPESVRDVSRADIEAGPSSMWRYAGLLPGVGDPATRVDVGAGWTRLAPAPRLAAELGMRELSVKDDSSNPTHSFKDRVVSVALSAARRFGFTTVACASTGNLAQAVAAQAAAVGLRSVVFVPADLEPGKIVSTASYGGVLVAVQGSYDDVNRLAVEVAGEFGWGFVNVNLRAFYAEGSKTVGFEIAEQLGWRIPEQVVIPIASGSLLTKVDQGFTQLVALSLAEPPPSGSWRVYGAQAAGCSPVATAFATGRDVVEPVRAATLAKSLAIGNPADGAYALETVRRTRGAIARVAEADIVAGMRLLARTTGILGETAGGVTVAGLVELVRSGALDPDAQTVVVNTGDGLKTLDPLAAGSRPTATIPARLGALRDLAAELGLVAEGQR